MEGSALVKTIPAVKEGRYVALDLTDALATGASSALSIEQAISEVLPLIIDVVG